MKTSIKYKFALGIAALAMLASGANVHAALILSQDFTLGNNTTALNGKTSTTGNLTWVSNYSDIKTDGTAPGSGWTYLPFTPTTGFIYTLTVDMQPTAGSSTDWLSMGFQTTAANNVIPASNAGWMLVRGTGGVNVGFTGASASTTSGSNNTFSVELNTTGAQWVNTYRLNGTILGAAYTFPTNPTIQNVGLTDTTAGKYNGTFSLTSVPEPSTWAMLAVGLTSMMVLRRRRQA